MNLVVDCKRIRGEITMPCSKSMAHRFLFACYYANNKSNIEAFSFPGISEDLYTTRKALLSLFENKIKDIQCNESGTTLRLLISALLTTGREATLCVRGSLASRPMQDFIDELNNHGARITSYEEDGKKFFSVNGKLQSGRYSLQGGISSQFISSLLFALPILAGNSEIVVNGDAESKPYIDLSINMLEEFGIEIIKNSYNSYSVRGNRNYVLPGNDITVFDGDWSVGAMWLVANKLLCNELTIKGLSNESQQGDAIIQDILEIEDGCDANISIKDCPDLAPALALWGLTRSAQTRISNASRLRLKECDRFNTIIDICNQLGADIYADGDDIVINGSSGRLLSGSDHALNTNNDHRMVMLAAFSSIVTAKPAIIDMPESVRKSYPQFFEEIERLGGYLKWN